MNKFTFTALIFLLSVISVLSVPGLKWSADIGHSFRNPVVSADKKFAVVGTDEGKVIWVNIADGTSSLTDKKMPVIESRYATAFRAAPLITSKDEVFAPNTDGRLYIREAKGKMTVLPAGASWGPMLASPTEIILKDKRRVLCPSLDGNIYAVNPDDKSWTIWYNAGAGIETSLTVGSYSSVVNVTVAQKSENGANEVVVTDAAAISPGDELRKDGRFIGFVKAVNDKTVIFNSPVAGELNIDDVLTTVPHLPVYFGANTGRVYALNGDLEKTNTRWVFPDTSTRVSSFVTPLALNGDKLFAVNRAGNIYCFNSNTGKINYGPIIADTETGTFISVTIFKDIPLFSTDNGTVWQMKMTDGKAALSKFYGSSRVVTQFSNADNVCMTDMSGDIFSLNSEMAVVWKYRYDFGKLLAVVSVGDDILATTADGKLIYITENGNYKPLVGGNISIRPGFTTPGILPDGGARWSNAFKGPQSYSPIVAFTGDTVRKTKLSKTIAAGTRKIPVADAANIFTGDYISIGGEDLGPVLEVIRDTGRQQLFVRDAVTHDYSVDTEIGTLLYRRAIVAENRAIEYKPVIKANDADSYDFWISPTNLSFPRDNFTLDMSLNINTVDKTELYAGLYLDSNGDDKRGELSIKLTESGVLSAICNDLRANCDAQIIETGKNNCIVRIECCNGIITLFYMNNEGLFIKFGELKTDYKAKPRMWNIFSSVKSAALIQPVINYKWYPGSVLSQGLQVTACSQSFIVSHGERLLDGDTIQLIKRDTGSSDLLKILRVDGNEVTLDADSRARYDYTSGDTVWAGVPAQWAVFTAGDDGVVRASDADSGRLLWKNDLRGDMGAVRVPMLVNNRFNRVYAASLSGRIFALSQTGLFCWAYPDFTSKPAAPFNVSMIMDASGSIIAADDAGIVYRVNADGAMEWKTDTSAGKPVKLSIFRWNETWRILLVTENKLLLISPLGEILKRAEIGKAISVYSDDKLYILNNIGELISYADFDALKGELVETGLPMNCSRIYPAASGWLGIADDEIFYTNGNDRKRFKVNDKITDIAIDNLGKIVAAAGNDVVCLPDISKWGDGKILWRKKMLSRITGVSLWYSSVIVMTEDGRMISLGAPRFDEKTEVIISSLSKNNNLTLLPGPPQPTLTTLPDTEDALFNEMVTDSNGTEYLSKNTAFPGNPGFMINPTFISTVIISDLPVGTREIPLQSASNFNAGDLVVFSRQNGADPEGYLDNYTITDIVMINTAEVKAVVKLNKGIVKSRAAGDVMILFLPDKYLFSKGAILPGQKVVLADQNGAKMAFGPNGMGLDGHFPTLIKKINPVSNIADIVLTRNNYPSLTENLKLKFNDADKIINAEIIDIIVYKNIFYVSAEKNVKKDDKIYGVLLSAVDGINVGDFIIADSFAGEIISLNKTAENNIFAVMNPGTCAWDEVKNNKVKVVSIASDIIAENIDNGVVKWRKNSDTIGLTGKVLSLTVNYRQAEIGTGRYNDMRVYGITEYGELFALNILGDLKWKYNLPLTGKVLGCLFNGDKSIMYVTVSGSEKSKFYAVKLNGIDDEKRIMTSNEIDGAYEKMEKVGNNIKLTGIKTSAIINPADGKVIENLDGIKDAADTRQIIINNKVNYILNNDGIMYIIGIGGNPVVKSNHWKFEELCHENRYIWKISDCTKNDKSIEINCSSPELFICKYADKISVYNFNTGTNKQDNNFSHPDNYFLTGVTNPGGIYDKLPGEYYASIVDKIYTINGKSTADISSAEKIAIPAGKYSQALSGKYIDTNNNGQWDYFEPIKKDNPAEIIVDKYAIVSQYPNIMNYVISNYGYSDDIGNFKMSRIGSDTDIIYDKNLNVDAPVGIYTAESTSKDNNINIKMQANKLIAEMMVSDCGINADFTAEMKNWRNYLDGAERNPTSMDINENDTVVIVSSDTHIGGEKIEQNKIDTQLWIRHLKYLMITALEDIKAGDKKIMILPDEIKNIHAADDSTSDLIEIKDNKGKSLLLARIIAADEESITIDRAIKTDIIVADCTITVGGAPWQPLLTDDEITEIQDKFADPGENKDAVPHPIRYEYPSINYNAERMLVAFTVSAVKRVTINGRPQYQPASYMVVKKCDAWGRGDKDGFLDWVESGEPAERNMPRNPKSYPTLITGLPNLDKLIIYESGSRGIFCATEDADGNWKTEIPFSELNSSLDDITRARAWVEHDEKDTRYFNMIFSASKNGGNSLYYARYRSEFVDGKLTFTLQPLTIADIDVDGRMIDDLNEITPGNFAGNFSAWQDLKVIIDGEEIKVSIPPGQETYLYKRGNELKIQINPYRGTARVLTGKVDGIIFTGYPSIQKLTESPGADKLPTKIVYGDDVAVSWIRSYSDWMGSRIYLDGWKLKRDPLFKNVVMRLEKNEIARQMVILSGMENDSDVVASDIPASDGKKVRLFTTGWRGDENKTDKTGRNDLFMSVISIKD